MTSRNQAAQPQALAADRLQKLVEIGIALSAQRDHNALMEKILVEAQGLCHAGGSTLYLRADESRLSFAIVRNDSLHLAFGGTSGQPVTFLPLSLYDEDTGERNEKNVTTYAALSGVTVNIPDAYTVVLYDFSGTKAFDERTGYRSVSFLTIPMKNYSDEVIGVTLTPNSGPGGSSPMRPERWSCPSWPVPASGSRCLSGAVVGYRRSRCTRIAQPWPRAG